MNSDELRDAYLKFFEGKGHKIIPSSSLIPQGDPTLLLTTAGMVQFKPYFTGEAVPPAPRLTSCQKCFRTTDIDSVGDTSHLTFFEMLGNFSIGDYFKKEAIAWAWEFVTEYLKLPSERLWITIFLDDDEAFDYWRGIGIPAEKIVRLGEKENFWGPAGDTGACGPCSEIHYDFGPEIGCGKPDCSPACDCGRFLEIWNLVFNQYNQDIDGNRTPLRKPGIDTGMGLDRTAVLMQGKNSVYETDLFTPLLDKVSSLTGKHYGEDEETDNAMRVVAEHSRSIAFLIGDGVMPSNEGRGYVLRRLLRRAALFGRRLGLDKPFLAGTAKVSIDRMSHVYPELKQRQDFILKVIQLEEESFGETLNTGIDLLDGIIGKALKKNKSTIEGKDAFRLYDTYGFPVELTREIASQKGLAVDMDGFETEMEQQRERARTANRFGGGGTNGQDIHLDLEETVFTGYTGLVEKSDILNILIGNEPVGSVTEGQEAGIILRHTPFYGEMGGQLGDAGEIRAKNGRFTVTDTIRVLPGIILHKGKVTEGTIENGAEVEAEVDRERRADIARNHTATHLLQTALRQVLGEHVHQRGSMVAPDRLRFDFSHITAVMKDELEQVQRIVNEGIRADLPVYDEQLAYKEAIAAGATALFDEKYGDTVRVLRIGRPHISAELCGGTHVSTTGEIGFFQIVSESSIGAGLRRIEAVTGRGAETYISRRLTDLDKISAWLETDADEAAEKTEHILSELRNERRKVQNLERQIAGKEAESLEDRVEVINGVNVLAQKVNAAGMDNLREMTDRLRDKLGSAVVVLGSVHENGINFVANVSQDLVDRGIKAGDILNAVAKIAGGRGGGKPNLAQGGGKDKEKIDEALREAARFVAGQTGK